MLEIWSQCGGTEVVSHREWLSITELVKIFFFFLRQVSCNPGRSNLLCSQQWSWTLDLPAISSQVLKLQVWGVVQFYVMLWIKPGVSCVLDKHSTNWALSPAPMLLKVFRCSLDCLQTQGLRASVSWGLELLMWTTTAQSNWVLELSSVASLRLWLQSLAPQHSEKQLFSSLSSISFPFSPHTPTIICLSWGFSEEWAKAGQNSELFKSSSASKVPSHKHGWGENTWCSQNIILS